MLTRPIFLWSAILVSGFLLLSVFFVLGYGLILLPMLVIGLALMLGAVFYHFWGEE
jgi:hypothetical protein